MRYQDFIKAIPGEIRDTRGNYTDIIAELGYAGAPVNLTNENAGYHEMGVATIRANDTNYELRDVLRNIATLDKALDVVTATHATSVSVADAVVGTPLKVKAESVLTQTGAGTQVFATPKPITGNAGVTVTNTVGGVATTYTLVPSTPLYGLSTATDSIQFDTGVVTRQTKHIILDGTEAWTSGANEAAPYTLTLSDKALGANNFTCSHSQPKTSGTTAETCVGSAALKTITFHPNTDAAYNTLTKWKAKLLAASTGESPVQLVYEIADATEQMLPTQIPAQGGTNVITHNAEGAVTVDYYRKPSTVADLADAAAATLLGFKGTLSAAPTTGEHFFNDKYFNSEPAAEEYIGWVCVDTGKFAAALSAVTATTIADTKALFVNKLDGLAVGQYVDVVGVAGPLIITFLPAAVTATTVDVTSAAAQKVLKVTATTGFAVGKTVCIGADATQEFGVIASIADGDSLTLEGALAHQHEPAEDVLNCALVDTDADAAVAAAAVSIHPPVFKGFGLIQQ